MSVTREQFQLQIDRLADTFHDKYFPEQRVHMIWESVHELEYPAVIAIVDSFIRASKVPPLPIDFAEAAKEYLKASGTKKYVLGEIQPKEIARCWDCGDSGFIRLARNEEFEEWARYGIGSTPCHCHRGKILIEVAKRQRVPTDLGPQFGEHWEKSYSIMPAWEEGK